MSCDIGDIFFVMMIIKSILSLLVRWCYKYRYTNDGERGERERESHFDTSWIMSDKSFFTFVFSKIWLQQ